MKRGPEVLTRLAVFLLLLTCGMTSTITSIQAQEFQAIDPNAKDADQKTLESIGELIKKREFTQAGIAIDRALQNDPKNIRFHSARSQLATIYMQAKDILGAIQQYEKIVESSFEHPEIGTLNLSGTVTTLNRLYANLEEEEKSAKLVDRALKFYREQESKGDGNVSSLRASVVQMVGLQAYSLLRQQKKDEAKQLINSEIQRIKKIHLEDPENEQNIVIYANLLKYAIDVFGDEPKKSHANIAELMKLVVTGVKQNMTSPLMALEFYASMKMLIGRDFRNEPERALMLLKATESTLKQVQAAQPDSKTIENQLKATKQLESQITAAKKIKDMQGKPAPEILAEHWINGDKLEELKGKVVLLDFFSVWSWPNIESLPRLNSWYDEFQGNGFEIISVTRFNNFQWDEDADGPMRAEKIIGAENEIKMLEKFAEKHQLKHRIIVTPRNGSMLNDFEVNTIPHTVLIDRKGVVRMVKVGANPKDISALRKMIEKLVKE